MAVSAIAPFHYAQPIEERSSVANNINLPWAMKIGTPCFVHPAWQRRGYRIGNDPMGVGSFAARHNAGLALCPTRWSSLVSEVWMEGYGQC